MFNYSINLIWSDEDGCYVATIPEFPGLSAFGETPEEAVGEAKIAAEGFIEVYKEDGCELPEPEKLVPYSGQTRLRLPKSLHAALSREAKKEGVSLNTYLVNLLSERNIARKVDRKLEEIDNHILGMGSILSGTLSLQTESEASIFKIDQYNLYEQTY